MKKNILVVSLFAFLATSCVDLNQEPLSFMSPDNIEKSEKNCISMLDGLYRNLWAGNYGYNCRLQILGLGADDMGPGNLAKRHANIDALDVRMAEVAQEAGDTQLTWDNFYTLAQAANQWMDSFQSATELSEEKRNSYIAEARFMRAFAYFNLIRFFGDVPCFIDAQCLKDINGSTTITRNSQADIYTKMIIPDLEFAASYLPEYSRADNNSRVGAWAAKACLADVYMTMAGWPLKQTDKYAKAAEIAKDIIENSGYELENNYEDLWKESTKSSRTEHIFALNHSKIQMASNYGKSYFITEENGWSDYTADPVFYENFPDDVRKDFNFVTKFKINGRMVPYRMTSMKAPAINKYRDYGGVESPQSAGITPIYRFADVLLMYAEAQNLSMGQPDQLAYDCLNRVRRRASKNPASYEDLTSTTVNAMPGTASESEKFNQLVFDERGYEFFAEFKRWFQLTRTEKVYDVNAGYTDAFGKERKANERVAKTIEELRITPENRSVYLFPLPAREVAQCHFAQNERAW